LRLGRACLESGQLDQALAHLLQAQEFAQGPAEAADIQREIGRTFEARRQVDRALEAYHEAIQLNPKQAENFLRAGMAHKAMKQYKEAQELFQRVIDLDPTNVEAHRQLVQVAAFDLLHGARLAALRS
jgi:tetratricopeptide (TPR) repeat protein